MGRAVTPSPRILIDPKGRRYLVPATGGAAKIEGLGVVDPTRLAGMEGRRVTIGGRSFLVLPASTVDLLTSLRREAQTIGPKDIASILLRADVRSGARVVEGGSGTGSLTVAVARAVGPDGSVVSYDLRPEALDAARANVERAGLASRVTFRAADLRQGITERDVDTVLVDIPDPWAAVPAAWDALRAGGHLATFSPNMEQVKETAAALRNKPFVDLVTIELIEREMEVRDLGVRPSFAALGHTGYLTFARKALDTF